MSNQKQDKPLVLLKDEIKTPPLSKVARIEAGCRLRDLQQGVSLSMPDSRPMPSIGKNCHELRIKDGNVTWRIVYRIDDDAVVVADVFKKKTRQTPKRIIDECRKRFREYDRITG
ncbi:MAG: type II toxin-antitoxin system RelE/ParE family toxin [Spartobacteria bacterium]|nr:type II toxin-antitoxin system RelE/ParE family toxin [Spartobacteria bacterium]